MFRQLGPLSKLHRLTIGLGLTPLNLLKKYTSAMWHVPKASGISEGVNTPSLTNPLIDLKGAEGDKANLLLNSFAGTSADGYVGVLCPNGKTVPFLQFDGINSYLSGNHPNLDIVGTGDFAIACVFKTGATISNGYILYSGNGTATLAYGMYAYSDGKLEINSQNSGQLVNGGAPCLVQNSLYSLLYYRKSGVLKCRLNKIQNFNTTNVNSLVSQQYFRVCASTSNGVLHASYSNIALGHLSITNGAITPFTEAELISSFDKMCYNQFGL